MNKKPLVNKKLSVPKKLVRNDSKGFGLKKEKITLTK